jgi:signal transduction histidine kinase
MDASASRLDLDRDRAPRNPLSLVRVETAIARSAAGIGLAFLVQAVPSLIGQADVTRLGWTVVAAAAIVASLVFTVVASILRRLVTLAMVTFAGVYLLVLITWPFAVVRPIFDSPWFYVLMTIATSAAAIALQPVPATVYLLAVAALYGTFRVTGLGGAIPPVAAVLNAVYPIFLGGAVLILVTLLRYAARDVDVAQATALERYTSAVRAHAMEAERVRVDAIVHDSVLTTLLTAARSETPEAMSLAATMAGNAIGHLRDAALVSPQQMTAVALPDLVARIRSSVVGLARPFEIAVDDRIGGSIPAEAGEALHDAVVQAAVNSVNHAGDDARRRIGITGGVDAIHVVVEDDGAGFDPRAVPGARLGVRVSILGRMRSAGGVARVRSAPGEGTTVDIGWPAPKDAASEPSEAPGAGASDHDDAAAEPVGAGRSEAAS